MITVTQAQTPEDLEAVRDLVRAFVRWAMAEIENSDNPAVFAGLETELADLPGRYSPPGDVWRWPGWMGHRQAVSPSSTGAMPRWRSSACLSPQPRVGMGSAGECWNICWRRALAMGHRRALLWSHHSMHSAHAVYTRAGFRKVPFSAEFAGATDGVDVCMERDLPPRSG